MPRPLTHRIAFVFAMTLIAGALSGCGDDASSTGRPDAGGDAGGDLGGDSSLETALVATSELPDGDGRCDAGGTLVEVGLDNGDGGETAGDGVLGSGEVDETQVVCDEVPDDVLASTSELSPGDANCPFGGTRVELGLDNGDGGETADDGVLGSGEVDETVFACDDVESGLLVEVTDLPFGDDDCPTGGQLIESGLDDGGEGGGGVAGDGVLAAEEVDEALVLCNVDVDAVFPAPEGPAGPHLLDISGGSSLNVDGAGGDAGSLSLELFAGPLPAAVELRENGDVDASFDFPTVELDLGDTSVTISEDTAVPDFFADGGDDPPSGLYLREDGSVFGPLPLYVGTEPVTGLRVEEGATLTFERPEVLLEGDLWNEGTIAAPGGRLELNTANLWNTATGLIETRSPGGAGRLELNAVVTEGASIYNEGQIVTSGLDGTEDAPASASDDLALVARGEIVNGDTGVISSRGGDHVASGTSGSELELAALAGDIRNSGIIESRGGRGQTGGGNGGRLRLRTAVKPSPFDSPDDFFEAETEGPGGLLHTGVLDSSGGDVVEGDGNAGAGGTGGDLEIALAGGDLLVEGDIVTRGGDTPVGTARGAGDVSVEVFLWADERTGALSAPERVAFATRLDLSGGTSTTGGPGGAGGSLSVMVDLSLTLPDTDEPIFEEDFPFVAPVDLARLAELNTGVRLQILGLGGGFDMSPGMGSDGGRAGSFTLRNAVCVGREPNCQLDRIGARLVFNELDIDASPLTRSGFGFTAGDVTLVTESAANGLDARTDASAVINLGAIDAGGGDSINDRGGQAGRVTLASEAGGVVNSGDISGLGGSTSGGRSGSRGAQVTIVGLVVTQQGAIDVTGGGGGEFNGEGGTVELLGLEVRNEGMIVADGGPSEGTGDRRGGTGGAVYLAGADLVDNSASISAAGGRAESSGDADGGEARRAFQGRPLGAVTLVGRRVNNSGSIDASGGEGVSTGGGTERASGGRGGEVRLRGDAVDNTGSIDASSGGADGPRVNSGEGGTVALVGSDVVNQATLDVSSGAVVGTSGFAGAGPAGEVVVGGRNEGAIEASSGDVTSVSSAFGSEGGSVTVLGENIAPITARGGDATATAGSADGGSGGSVAIIGTNSAPVVVQGGQASGTSSATAGFGGDVTIEADNDGDITARGGDATGEGSTSGGNGGRIEVAGDNSGCLDASVGAGTDGEPEAGTIVVDGADSGSCE